MPSLADNLVGVRAGIGQHLVRVRLGGAGEPVGGVLGQGQDPSGLHGLFLVGPRRRRRRHGCRDRSRPDRLGLGFGLGLEGRNRLGGLSGGTAAPTGQFLVQLRYALAQIGVLFDEPSQLVFHQVEEGVDLVLVITTLADGRLTERHVVDVGWGKRHC